MHPWWRSGTRRSVLTAPSGRKETFDPRRSACWLTLDDGLSQKLATIAGIGISAYSPWNVYGELTDSNLVRALPNYIIVDHLALWLAYTTACTNIVGEPPWGARQYQ